MGAVRPIPRLGGVLPDARGRGRALRISWHHEDGLVVLSLWDGPRCTGTLRLAAADVPALIEALQLGLTGDGPVTGFGDTRAAGPGGGPAPGGAPAGPTGDTGTVPEAPTG
jgi:hypothetical protein